MTDDTDQGGIFQVVGRFTLRPGTEAEWDAAFRERIEKAASAPGWLGVAAWAPLDAIHERIVIGRWRAREDYDAWALGESYLRTKSVLDSCQTAPPNIEWFRSVVIMDKAGAGT